MPSKKCMEIHDQSYHLLRTEIKHYLRTSQRESHEVQEGRFLLNNNENPYDFEFSRFFHGTQLKLIERVGVWRNIAPDRIVITNGALQAIDFLMRLYCEPGLDHIQYLGPIDRDLTHLGTLNGIVAKAAREIALLDDTSKITLLSNPNPITGELLPLKSVRNLAKSVNGLLLIDESLIDYSPGESSIALINKHPNLVILQTFDYALGGAGLNLGMLFGNVFLVDTLKRMEFPHAINQVSMEAALMRLNDLEDVYGLLKELLNNREILRNEMERLTYVEHIYPSHANFLLVKVKDARKLDAFLFSKGILVKNCSSMEGLENCLRITIGSPEENHILLQSLIQFDQQ
jgi:histidinol-phosphate aminotransferase